MAEVAVSAFRLFGVAAAEGGSPAPLPEGVQLVPFRDLAAIVSEAAYAPMAGDGRATDEHLRVVASVAQHRAILPAPVGVVFVSQEVMLRWMELHYVALSDGIGFIEGRVEARVHMRLRDEHILDETRADLAAVATESFRQLRRHVVAALPVKAGHDPAELLSGAFLVEEERWQSFVDAVGEEEARQGVLHLEMTGPWPPFDFVRMQFGG